MSSSGCMVLEIICVCVETYHIHWGKKIFPPLCLDSLNTTRTMLLTLCSFSNIKVYVQHLLKKNKENIWKLINNDNAHIYVCG